MKWDKLNRVLSVARPSVTSFIYLFECVYFVCPVLECELFIEKFVVVMLSLEKANSVT